MGDRQHNGPKGRAPVDEMRRAWFDGWTEGVIWTLSRTMHVLREAGHPESIGWSVIQDIVPGSRRGVGRTATRASASLNRQPCADGGRGDP